MKNNLVFKFSITLLVSIFSLSIFAQILIRNDTDYDVKLTPSNCPGIKCSIRIPANTDLHSQSMAPPKSGVEYFISTDAKDVSTNSCTAKKGASKKIVIRKSAWSVFLGETIKCSVK